MKIGSTKAKGRRLAQHLTNKLIQFSRGSLTENDVRPTSSSVTGPDILCSQRALDALPFAWECKNQERLNIWDALKQARGHVPEGSNLKPVVCFSKNFEGRAYVALSLEDFLEIVWPAKTPEEKSSNGQP